MEAPCRFGRRSLETDPTCRLWKTVEKVAVPGLSVACTPGRLDELEGSGQLARLVASGAGCSESMRVIDALRSREAPVVTVRRSARHDFRAFVERDGPSRRYPRYSRGPHCRRWAKITSFTFSVTPHLDLEKVIVQQGLGRLCVLLPWIGRPISKPPPYVIPKRLVLVVNRHHELSLQLESKRKRLWVADRLKPI
jgi:hypothetical protein